MSPRGCNPRFAAAMLGAALYAAAPLALAQDAAGPARDAAAVAQRERGIAMMRAGNLSASIAAFEQSLALVDSPNTHFDLGRAYFNAGRLASALRQFERARDDATARVQAGQLQYRLTAENASRAAEELSPRVPRVVLRFSQAPPDGTEVRLDDEAVPASALVGPIPVDSGPVRIELAGRWVRPRAESRRLAEGESAVVQLAVEPVGEITVAVSPPIAGLAVLLDGHALAPAQVGAPVPIEPGVHRVEVRAPGVSPWVSQARILVGTPARLDVTLANGRAQLVGPGAAMPQARGGGEVDASSNGGRTASYVVGGVGIAAAVAGAALWAFADSEYNALQPQCVGGCTEPSLASRASTAHTAETAGVALMVGGGIALAAGVVAWVITRPHAGEATPERARVSAGPGGLLVRF